MRYTCYEFDKNDRCCFDVLRICASAMCRASFLPQRKDQQHCTRPCQARDYARLKRQAKGGTARVTVHEAMHDALGWF